MFFFKKHVPFSKEKEMEGRKRNVKEKEKNERRKERNRGKEKESSRLKNHKKDLFSGHHIFEIYRNFSADVPSFSCKSIFEP